MFKKKFFTKWIVLAALIGIIAGLGAVAFFYMLEFSTALLIGYMGGYMPPTPQGEQHLFIFSEACSVSWRIVFIITLGGLISGLIVYNLAPEAEGHGTDAYISAFHYKGGYVRERVPFVKAIASAIIIGSGGSAGREGPIAQIGSGGGSYIASRLNLSDKDRRIAIICGAAGGIGAIFKAPLGGAIFAIEVLYRKDLESDGLLPSFISSTVAYSIFGLFFGFNPIFKVPQLVFDITILYLFIFLGVICAPIAVFYILFFYFMKDRVFSTKKIPNYMKPAIGAFLVGLIALFIPQILGPGYGIVQQAIYVQIGLGLLVVIIFAKIIATSFTIGSGGSGGVFAPSLVVGATIGGAFALFLRLFYPLSDLEVALFVIVGMAAFVAGVASVLIAPIIMVAEMTGTFSLLVPAMLSCTIAYILTNKWTIYQSQVPNKAYSPVHQGKFAIDILEQITAKDVMSQNVDLLNPRDKVTRFSEYLRDLGHTTYPVVDDDNLVGVVSYKDVLKVPAEKFDKTLIEEIMTTNLLLAYLDDNLSEVLIKMELHNHGHLPVVDKHKPNKLMGLISKQNIVKAHNLQRNILAQKRKLTNIQNYD